MQALERYTASPFFVRKPAEPPNFVVIMEPCADDAYRAFIPSSTTFTSWVALSDPGQQDWERGRLARVVDDMGIYKIDHGFKNGRKVRLPDGSSTKMAILTGCTSLGLVAFQVFATSTGLDDLVPSWQGLRERCKELDVPVSM